LNGANSTLAAVGTTNPSSITNNSAVSGGNVTAIGTSAVTARGVCWSTSPLPTVSLSTKTVNGSGAGTFTSNIPGLSPGTSYYVRAYATNSAGTAYGNEIMFTTSSPLVVPNVNTVAVSGITQTTAISGGTVSSDGGATVTARGVCWSTSPNPTINISNQTNDGSGIGTFNSAISGLSPSTLYYVRSYATNSVGTSYGNQTQFTTLPNGTLATLITNTILVIDNQTAESGGIIESDGGFPISARGVCWNTDPNPTVDLSTKTIDGSGIGEFSSTLANLSPNTFYYVRSYATNALGTAYGNELTFSTIITNTSELRNSSQVYAIPNPSSGLIRFNGFSSKGEISIRSLHGKEMLKTQIVPGMLLDLSILAKSAYFYSIQTVEGNFRGKLVLQ